MQKDLTLKAMCEELSWLIRARAAGLRLVLVLAGLLLGLSLFLNSNIFERTPSFTVLRGVPEAVLGWVSIVVALPSGAFQARLAPPFVVSCKWYLVAVLVRNHYLRQ